MAQPVVEGGGRRAPGVEHVARHDLEQVAAGELLPGLLDHPGIAARYRIRRKLPLRNGPARPRPGPLAGLVGGRPRQPFGRPGRGRELVGVALRGLPLAVQHPQLVRQVQHQVTLSLIALMPEPDRLELEGQVVAESAVQAEMRVRPGQRRDHLAQRGEHGGPVAALFLRESGVALRDDDLDRAAAGRHDLARPAECRLDDRQQDLAAGVQRSRGDPPAAGHDLGRGVDIRHVPATVPARVLHPGTEHAAAAAVDLPGYLIQQGRVERCGTGGDRHAAGGDELGHARIGVGWHGPSHDGSGGSRAPGRLADHEKGGRRIGRSPLVWARTA